MNPRLQLVAFVIAILISAASQAAENLSDGKASWTERVTLFGDLRYRHEMISEEDSQGLRHPDRHRHRIRFRIGLKAAVNQDIDLVGRLASGSIVSNTGAGSPISSDQDLGNGFSPKYIWLDRAFADYHPTKAFSARAGKFGVPFEGSDLIWDTDLNLEGITASARSKVGDLEFTARAGGLWASERASRDGPDQGLFGGQAGGRVTMGDLSGQLSLAYFDYGNVKNGPTLYHPTSGFGNSVTVDSLRPGRTAYRNDFNLAQVHGVARAKFGTVAFDPLGDGARLESIAVALTADFVVNTGADEDTANTAWLAGINFKAKSGRVDWELGYDYRDLQADGTLAAFTSSDHIGGGTNYAGHKLFAAATVMENTRLAFHYVLDQRDSDHADYKYERFMADLEVKF